MNPFLKFDIDGIDSVEDVIRKGIAGYATDSLVLHGMSTVWLFLGNGEVLKISTRMTDTVGWTEVGTLVFSMCVKHENIPQMIELPQAWRNISKVEKLLVSEDEFSAEGGLKICNVFGEKLIIVCSENVYQIEIMAPFFCGNFLPEYDLSYYRCVPMQE